MVGAGTPADPRRPLYAPVPGERSPLDRSGIIAFTFVASDDGINALVEFVARERAGFEQILREKEVRQDIKVFEKGKDKKEDIEKEFKKHKRNFRLDDFQGVPVL